MCDLLDSKDYDTHMATSKRLSKSNSVVSSQAYASLYKV